MWLTNRKTMSTILLLALFAGFGVAPARAQQKTDAELDRLRAEVAKLRLDLDAAVREIKSLKEAMRTGNAVPENEPLYHGKPARYWQAQLSDAEQKSRVEAVQAIGALAGKDKKLIPVLLDVLKTDEDGVAADYASKELSALGAEVLRTLIEIAKDKTQPIPRRRAIQAIGGMRAKAKPAIAVLVKALDDKTDIGLMHWTVYALGNIGPDAKEAIPALVHALGATLEDSNKPQSNGSRFGTNAESMNNKILDVLLTLDPDLGNELKRPRIFISMRKDADRLPPPQEVRDAWQKVHETLVKKYVAPK